MQTLFVCIFLLFMVIPRGTHADSRHMQFKQLTADEGLKIGFVYDTIQDHQGFLWISGSEGLARYDGYEYKIYRHRENDETSLSTDGVWDLVEDNFGTLWVATPRGLNRYNRDKDNFTTFFHNVDDHGDANRIESLLLGDNNNLWMATGAGLIEFKIETQSFRSAPLNISPNWLSVLAKDNQGLLWVAGEAGTLISWDPKTYKKTPYFHNPKDNKSLLPSKITEIFADSLGDIWVGSYDGLAVLNRNKGVFQHFKNDPNNLHSLGANVIFDILEDSRGDLWVGTDGGGLNLYHRDSDTFSRFKNDITDPSSISSNVARSIYEDPQGDLWVGMYPSGLNHYDRSNSPFVTYRHNPLNKNSLNNNDVGAVAEDEHGNLWFGTSGGINYFDRKNNIFRHYQNDPKDPGTLGASPVMTIYYDSQNRLWAGTWAGGLYRLDPGAKAFRHYTPEQGNSKSLAHLNVWSIIEDRNGTMWFGTEAGLNRYNPKDDSFTRYVNNPSDGNSIKNSFVWVLKNEYSGKIWVGTNAGLDLFDPETEQFSHLNEGALRASSIRVLYEDRQHRLWVGAHGNGLTMWNPHKKQLKSYRDSDGLLSNTLTGILGDASGNLWLGSSEGLTKFDSSAETFQHFDKGNGLQGNEFSLATIETRKGEFVFGGRKGFTLFNPRSVQKNAVQPRVRITDFTIANQSVEIGKENSPLMKDISQTDHLTLTADQSVFSFTFSAMSFRIPSRNQYAYKLESFETEWQEVGHSRTATYTNLNPGDYTFIVKASNNENVWGEERQLKITVLPPWWRTWWAYSLYALLFIGQLARIIYAQFKKRQVAERLAKELEEKVCERTAELHQKNNDIQGMLGNMHQGLFTILGELRIHDEYSAYLESIFERTEIGGMDPIELIFNDADICDDELEQIKHTLKLVMGEDELNYGFNSHIFPTEVNLMVKNQNKILELDWSPMIESDLVCKIMVSVRDVTQLKLIEVESRRQQKELEIISQLIKVKDQDFREFERTTQALIQECLESVQAYKNGDLSELDALFRNMHTIKGDSRTYQFKHICEIAHHAETLFTEIHENPGEASQASKSLLRAIEDVNVAQKQYSKVYYEVLGHNENSQQSDEKGIWVDKETAGQLQDSIAQVLNGTLGGEGIRKLSRAKTKLDRELTNTLDDMLNNIVESLPSLAETLGKHSPQVEIDAENVRIKETSRGMLNKVFTHILRNSLDHGLEATEDRLQQGKNAQGKIKIEASGDSEKLQIRVKDDGQGLNLERLYKKGLESKRWSAQCNPSTSELAQLIFAPGLSTKDEVSEISGRGVGMDAVKHFLKENGCDIDINLLDHQMENPEYAPFELVINLAPEYFYQVA